MYSHRYWIIWQVTAPAKITIHIFFRTHSGNLSSITNDYDFKIKIMENIAKILGGYIATQVAGKSEDLFNFAKKVSERGTIMLQFESFSNLVSATKQVFQFLPMSAITSFPDNHLSENMRQYDPEKEFVIYIEVGPDRLGVSAIIQRDANKNVHEKFKNAGKEIHQSELKDYDIKIKKETDRMIITNEKVFCNSCGKDLVDSMLCSKCKLVYYCNKECQKTDWKNHKEICKKM